MAAPNYTISLVAYPIGVSSVSAGQCVVWDPTTSTYLVATTANRATNKTAGILLGSAPVNGSALMQCVGDCPNAITGLGAGLAGPVRASATGTLERIGAGAATSTDDVVGWAEIDGLVHLGCGGMFASPYVAGSGLSNSAYVIAPMVQNISTTFLKTTSILGVVQTTDATQTTLLSYSTFLIGTAAFDAIVTCTLADGSKGGRWKRSVLYRRAGGPFIIVGSLETGTDQKTDAGLDCTLDTVSNTLRVRVTGLAATTLRWGCELRVQEQSG